MKAQKQAVIDEVKAILGSRFIAGQSNALSILTSKELEQVKANISCGILSRQIAYSKNVGNGSEVISYARSMVMNHLKKAPELNGGIKTKSSPVKASNPTHSVQRKVQLPKGVIGGILPPEILRLASELVTVNG